MSVGRVLGRKNRALPLPKRSRVVIVSITGSNVNFKHVSEASDSMNRSFRVISSQTAVTICNLMGKASNFLMWWETSFRPAILMLLPQDRKKTVWNVIMGRKQCFLKNRVPLFKQQFSHHLNKLVNKLEKAWILQIATRWVGGWTVSF